MRAADSHEKSSRRRVVALGKQADGIFEDDRRNRIFVAGALPEEEVSIGPVENGRARLLEVVRPSAERTVPACPHFDACGGCSAQHMGPRLYATWKRGLVIDALAREGLTPPVAPLIPIGPGTRRRARLFVRRTADAVLIGFHEERSHRIVDMRTCPALSPAIFSQVACLRAFFGDLLKPGERAEAELQDVDGALDVVLTAARELDLELSRHLAGYAEQSGVARLWWRASATMENAGRRAAGKRRGAAKSSGGAALGGQTAGKPEQVITRHPVQATFGGVAVALPGFAFLQASSEGERHLTRLVTAAIPDGSRVADLFAGAGTFTFPLAAGHRVAAFEGDGDAVAALDQAARRAGMGERVSGSQRDLARRPLMASELNAFDACVFDPPRAGARAQAEQLAASRVPRVIGVSCHPASFARDARTLVDGGYCLESIQPVDQFIWTAHVELVGIFSR